MSEDNFVERYPRHTKFDETLTCYTDTEEAKAVCGKCGRPVCGPVMNASFRDLIRSIFKEYGHGRRFRDSTFHHYENGIGHALLAISLLGISILLGVIFPNFIPGVVATVTSTPIYLNAALVQSAAIIGIAMLITLQFQRGGHTKLNLRVRTRQTGTRTLCDECFGDTFVQLALFYLITAIAIVLAVVGLREMIGQANALPLRIFALGIGFGILRDDLVTYAVEALDIDADTKVPSTTEPEYAED